MVTIRMVAERCGMSVAAVSRALNHRAGVAPEKAEEIRRMAREMGYCPNAYMTGAGSENSIAYRKQKRHCFARKAQNLPINAEKH